jgi:hypothetical protein
MKDCKFCDKEGLLILPLRYAAVVGAADPKAASAGKAAPPLLPDLAATLGEKVKELVLKDAKYSPRLMRNGYLYVLIVRKKIPYWEGYLVLDDSFFYKFPVALPPPTVHIPFTCDRDSCGLDASVISIDDIANVQKIYFLYSPTPLTPAKLAEYKHDPVGRKGDTRAAARKMQEFDPLGWSNGAKTQIHSMKPEQLHASVPEFILYKMEKAAPDSSLGKVLATQLFEPTSAAYAGLPAPAPEKPAPGRLGLLQYKLSKLNGAVFVVHDPIGITQELNNYRNASFARIDEFLELRDKFQVTNSQKLIAHEKIQDLRTGFENNLLGEALREAKMADIERRSYIEPTFPDDSDYVQISKLHGSSKPYRHPSRAEWEATHPEEVAKFEAALAKDLQVLPEAAKLKSKAKWEKRYLPKLDAGEMSNFTAAFDAVVADAKRSAAWRESDHLTWVTSSQLVQALEVYDKSDALSGHAFEGDSALCTFGMTGSKTSAEQVEKWLMELKEHPEKVSSDNIYLRGYYMNQTEIEEAAKIAMPQIREMGKKASALDDVYGPSVFGVTKKIIDTFKKIDSAYDEFARYHTQGVTKGWGKTREAAIFAKHSEIIRTIFRSGLGGKLDLQMGTLVGVMNYARLGKIAYDVGYDEFMLKAKKKQPERFAPGFGGKEKGAVDRIRTAARASVKNLPRQLEVAMLELIDDARTIVKDKTNLSLKQLLAELEKKDAGKAFNLRTNNYHQARIGVALASLELLSIGAKLSDFKGGCRGYMELSASALGLMSISADIMYANIKSIRETSLAGNAVGELVTDIRRGGWKMWAGGFAVFAGFIQLGLDGMSLNDEAHGKQRGAIMTIYVVRGGVSAMTTYYSALAAASYSGPTLKYIAETTGRQFSKKVTVKVASLAAQRVFLLLRVARFSTFGLALTAAELAYYGYVYFIADDAVESWCLRSTFRREKSHKNIFGRTIYNDYFANADAEDAAFHEARKDVLGI